MTHMVVCSCGAIRKKDKTWKYSAVSLSHFLKEVLKDEHIVTVINLSLRTCPACRGR
jgi:hypothetical protein